MGGEGVPLGRIAVAPDSLDVELQVLDLLLAVLQFRLEGALLGL